MGTLHRFTPRFLSSQDSASCAWQPVDSGEPRKLARIRACSPGKRVVLRLAQPSTQGISVTLQIGEEGQLPHTEMTGWLPPADRLLVAQQQWQNVYQQLHVTTTRLEAPASQVTNVSYQALFERCGYAHRALKVQINRWLNSERFRPLKEVLLSTLMPADTIRFVVQTDNRDIRALPLQLWDWFEHYSNAELVLSGLSYSRVPFQSTAQSAAVDATVEPEKYNRVRILAIFGEGQGLDLARDRLLLEQLPNVALTCFVTPTRSQLNDTLWQQPWDILFFAGHSTFNNQKQQLRLSKHETLALSELSYGLRRATRNGLKLAILNTCDGLALLESLSGAPVAKDALPAAIAMRYPVPDVVAQAFLMYFLTAFSGGRSLPLAVRDARERLQGLGSQYPCATWLPVLCQSPVAAPLVWERLVQSSQRNY